MTIKSHKLTVSSIDLKTGHFGKDLRTDSMIRIECGGVFYCMTADEHGSLRIHIAGGDHALVVYPTAANAIAIKQAEYP